MLFNHDLVRKLRYVAAGISTFVLGYTILAFRDHHVNNTQLILVIAGILISLLCSWLLKNGSKRLYFTYLGSMLLVLGMLLFRMRSNLAIDLTVLAVTVGVAIALWLQIRKKNEFA